METIQELFRRKIKVAESNLKMAQDEKATQMARLEASLDRAIGVREGQLHTLENLAELDWKQYCELTALSKTQLYGRREDEKKED